MRCHYSPASSITMPSLSSPTPAPHYSLLLLFILANLTTQICDSFLIPSPLSNQIVGGIGGAAGVVVTKTTIPLFVQTPKTTTIPTITTTKTKTTSKKSWYPTRPNDALTESYHKIVRAAHLRHILVHTSSVATLALKSLPTLTSADPFGELARSLSICESSKPDGGRLGWIDNPFHDDYNNNNNTSAAATEQHPLLPLSAIRQLFQNEPKGGDTLLIPSPLGHHLIRIDDLLTTYLPHAGRNTLITARPPLPGRGHAPLPPTSSTSTSPLTYALLSTGCQMNQADAELMETQLRALSLTPSPTGDISTADVVLINTCSIRDRAERKLYDLMGPVRKRKREGSGVSLIVTGCVAQQEGRALVEKCPEVDLVMGPQYANRLGVLMEDVWRGYQIVAVDPTLYSEGSSGGEEEGRRSAPAAVRGSDVTAFVNVIYGCNERCTYCVVPTVRGVEQSRSKEAILKEINELEAVGYREVTLLGQNIDAYGRDMVPRETFGNLLHYLNANAGDGIERIRYVTSHPRYFSDAVIDAVANLDKVCECFHMPFQAGDDEVLKRMRRGYSYKSYMTIIDKIRQRAPQASITADVIVGFPGETEEAFQRTLDLMEEVKFDNINSFTYSPRPNTEAALWEDDTVVPERVKKERLRRLQAVAVRHALERSERYVGTTVEVLVEGANPKDERQVMGRVRQGRQVFFDGDVKVLKGAMVMVEITEARPWSLSGTMTEIVRC